MTPSSPLTPAPRTPPRLCILMSPRRRPSSRSRHPQSSTCQGGGLQCIQEKPQPTPGFSSTPLHPTKVAAFNMPQEKPRLTQGSGFSPSSHRGSGFWPIPGETPAHARLHLQHLHPHPKVEAPVCTRKNSSPCQTSAPATPLRQWAWPAPEKSLAHAHFSSSPTAKATRHKQFA